jgi:hypothetical protein
LESNERKYVVIENNESSVLYNSNPAAVMELVSIGLQSSQTTNISKEIMSLFEDKLHMKSDRMHIKFTNVSGNMMGWNKETF